MSSPHTPLDAFAFVRSAGKVAFAALPLPAFQYGLDIRANAVINFESVSAHAEREAPFTYEKRLDGGIILCDLDTALKKYPHALAALGSQLSLEDKFESFHLANVRNGLFVLVPAHVNAHAPIPIPSPTHTFAHIFVVAEPHSRSSFFLADSVASPALFRSTAIEIIAEEGAHVSWTSLQSLPSTHTHISFKRARVAAHGKVSWAYAEMGSAFVKSDVSGTLNGDAAALHSVGLALGNASQVFDLHDHVTHLAPRTHSLLRSRSVLDDSSKLVYRALLKMVKEAPGSIGNQRSDTLVLSPSAEADPVPALEIEGSEVHCSHAATVGRLDNDKLFYLTSRGLDEATARTLYIQGFIETILGYFPIVDESAHLFRIAISTKLGLSVDRDTFITHPKEVLA